MTRWTQADALDLCRRIEAICPAFGCHVALTGGCLYGEPDTERKDADILFYRVRQVEAIDLDGLFAALEGIGVHVVGPTDCWVVKAQAWLIPGHYGDVDLFFPEHEGNNYRVQGPADSMMAPFVALSDEELCKRHQIEENAAEAWLKRAEASRAEIERRRYAPQSQHEQAMEAF